MRGELLTAGYAVDVVTVNDVSGADSYEKLLEQCSFPVFQDTPDVSVWTLQDGGKDDIYIYAKDGSLAYFLPANGGVSTNLSTAAGYENLRSLVIDVAGQGR